MYKLSFAILSFLVHLYNFTALASPHSKDIEPLVINIRKPKINIRVVDPTTEDGKKPLQSNIQNRPHLFETFLHNFFHTMLVNFSAGRLRHYCRLLAESFDFLPFKETTALQDHLTDMCHHDRHYIKETLKTYQIELLRQTPYKMQFLRAINKAFTMTQGQEFRSYIQHMNKYARNLEIDTEIELKTRSLIRSTIISSIQRLSIRDQVTLKGKLNKAIMERLALMYTLWPHMTR